MTWDTLTDIILLAALAVYAIFVYLGIYQWVTCHRFAKIDPELRWAILPSLLAAAVFFLFDYAIVLNTRPNGSGEPSFPSSHVLLVATVFSMVAIALPQYIKPRPLRLALDLLMLALTALVAVGRVLADMHWVSDVVGALVFSGIFAVVYYLIIRRYHHA